MTDSKKLKRPHLGRGLEALLGQLSVPAQETSPQRLSMDDPEKTKPNFPPDKELKDSHHTLNVSQITPNPFQPRTTWNEQELEELTSSIKANGIIQPIIVRQAGDSGYQIIAGERRFRAAQKAGLTQIPVFLRNATDQQMLELALVENIHRSNLKPIERSKAYQNYINTFNLTHNEAADRLGEDRSVVTNYIRLLELPTEIKDMLNAGDLTMGHAKAILGIQNDQLKKTIAAKAMAGRLSVREVERLVRLHLDESHKTQKEKKTKEAFIIDLENQLKSILGTKVKIESGRRNHKGRIIIEYYSLDDFDRLTEKMGMVRPDVS